MTDTHWFYVSDPKIPFYRVGSYSNVSSSMAPFGCSSLWAEVAFPSADTLTAGDLTELEATTLDAIGRMGLLARGATIEFVDVDVLNPAYVLFTEETDSSSREILNWLREMSIVSVGRYGEWKYDSMEGAILDGFRSVDG